MTPKGVPKAAPEKILDAAADVFGHRGYKAATVREICRAAGVNIAAINYYFGGKRELYRRVVRALVAQTFARYPVDAGTAPGDPPERRLEAFVRGVLGRLLAPDGLSGYAGKGQLMARELADPSPFIDDLVDEFIRPVAGVLAGIVAELLGPDVRREDAERCQVSVIGQCFHYAMARPVVSRLMPLTYADEALIDALGAHITRFSLAGLQAVRKAASPAAGQGSPLARQKKGAP